MVLLSAEDWYTVTDGWSIHKTQQNFIKKPGLEITSRNHRHFYFDIWVFVSHRLRPYPILVIHQTIDHSILFYPTGFEFLPNVRRFHLSAALLQFAKDFGLIYNDNLYKQFACKVELELWFIVYEIDQLPISMTIYKAVDDCGIFWILTCIYIWAAKNNRFINFPKNIEKINWFTLLNRSITGNHRIGL